MDPFSEDISLLAEKIGKLSTRLSLHAAGATGSNATTTNVT